MTKYSDPIEHENENSRLDFKKTQYRSEDHRSLIKDVMSLANANVDGDRHIIIGVYFESGERMFNNTPKEDVKDPAIYQQIIHENIEPDIDLAYFPFEHKGINFTIFEIKNCNDRPYMMRKENGSLKKGDAWIRKGAHQHKMIRSDFDSIYEEKFQKQNLSGDLKVLFSDTKSDEIVLPKRQLILRSEREKKRIKQIIEQKEKKIPDIPEHGIESLISATTMSYLFGHTRRYEDMSVELLEEKLKDIDEKFIEHDLYEFFEKNSSKINVIIENTGEQYIEDATVQLIFDNIRGICIADRIYRQPSDDGYLSVMPYIDPIRGIEPIRGPRYPDVSEAGNKIIVVQNIGNIKHKIPINAFGIPIRITITDDIEIDSMSVICKVFGKNLANPIEKRLTIHISDPSVQEGTPQLAPR